MSNKLNFLTTLAAVTMISAVAQKETTTKEDSTTKRVEKNPTNGADFRILSNGKVYPSADFVADFGLEYLSKTSGTKSMGLDLFDSSTWAQLQGAPQMLLGYIVDQDKPKVKLFAGTRYKEDGSPINSVMDQGTVVSDDTLEMIAVALGVTATVTDEVANTAWDNLLDGRRFVDFYMLREAPSLMIPDGIYQIPKTVARGENKNEVTTVKRELIKVLPIIEFTDEVAAELKELTGDNMVVVTDETPDLEEVTSEPTALSSEEEETADQLYERLQQPVNQTVDQTV